MTRAPNAKVTPLSHATGWQASLRLQFAPFGERTGLRRREQRGPLAVQRPFYPEGATCHLYLLHPPGGVVGGDRLHLDADVQPGARALVTTPGATKFYRSSGVPARLTQRLVIADDGQLEWLPQEHIFFAGADVDLRTEVRLAGQGRFIGWEVNCLGRPANDETFDTGRIDNRLTLYRDGEPWFCDRLLIDATHRLHGPARLRGQPVTASLLAAPVDERLLALVRDRVRPPADAWWGATRMDNLLVVRYLGRSTEQAKRLCQATWCLLREPLLNRIPSVPRIWAT